MIKVVDLDLSEVIWFVDEPVPIVELREGMIPIDGRKIMTQAWIDELPHSYFVCLYRDGWIVCILPGWRRRKGKTFCAVLDILKRLAISKGLEPKVFISIKKPNWDNWREKGMPESKHYSYKEVS